MTETRYRVQSLERAVSLLNALAEANEPETLTGITARVHLNASTAFRLLHALQDERLVVLHPKTGRYSLGMRILEWSDALLRQFDIIEIARPVLAAVRNRVNETASLIVRNGDFWVPLAKAEGSQPIRHVINIGRHAPLYAGAAGKVFLAAFCDDDIEAYLQRTELAPIRPATPTDPDVLRRQIASVRSAGFSESVNEYGGGAGLAAAIRGHDGQVVAALEVSGPPSRFDPEARSEWIEAALAGSSAIAEALGFRDTEPASDGRKS